MKAQQKKKERVTSVFRELIVIDAVGEEDIVSETVEEALLSQV